jgi:uncharacterized SAM-binding protein YcdF (DUF218 family)
MSQIFFVFSKIFYIFLNPLLWILILLAIAMLIKNLRSKKLFLWISFISLYFFSNVALQTAFMKMWEYPAQPVQSIQNNYQYAIVLGGMADKDEKTGKILIAPTIDRLLQAIILYNQHKVQKIVVTGGSGMVTDPQKKESLTIKELCLQLGIPPQDIITETESKNTYQNAIFTKKYIPSDTKVLLITSAFHMPRASAIFKKAGYKFDVLATDPLSRPLYFDDYILPKPEAISNWIILLKEISGYITYKIVGYC